MSARVPETEQQRALHARHERDCATYLHYFTHVEHLGGRTATTEADKIPGWIIQTASCPPPPSGVIPLYAMFPHPPAPGHTDAAGSHDDDDEDDEKAMERGALNGFLLCRTVMTQARAFGHMLGSNEDVAPETRRLIGHVPLYVISNQDMKEAVLFVWTQQTPPLSATAGGRTHCVYIGAQIGADMASDTIILPANAPMPEFLNTIARALHLPGVGFATVDTRHPNTDELGHLVSHLPGALSK